MTSPPAFQWYARDWLSECASLGLTHEESGAYAHLKSICWLEGSVPVDAAKLARILRTTPKQAAVWWESFASRFEVRGDIAVHPELEQQREAQQRWREKSSKGGRASAAARSEAASKGG